MIKESELREMSQAERRQLARALAAIDSPRPMLGLYLSRRRRVGVIFSVISCVVLACWIVVLLLSLHRSFHAHHWRGAWVGFDIILLLSFAATGWAFWRSRQIVIAFLLITATMLCCDAWFDVFLDAGSNDIWSSVAAAVIVELPLAFLMFNAARRLIRISVHAAMIAPEEPPDPAADHHQVPIWKIPLAGVEVPAQEHRAGHKGRTTHRPAKP